MSAKPKPFKKQKIDVQKKLAGLLLPVFALRRPGDIGVGDTQCVIDAIEFLAKHGMTVLQLLPINETGADNSPYNALSSIALDPVYLTLAPELVPGLSQSTIDERVDSQLLHELAKGPVRYPQVKSIKLAILQDAYDTLIGGANKGATRGKAKTSMAREIAAFAAFKTANKWLETYSLFRALVQENNDSAVWTQWPIEHQNLASATKLANESEHLTRQMDFFKYVQWVAFSQWAQVRAHADKHGVELMGDIPFGISRYSADVFGNRDLFDLERSGGAPPETFFQSDKFTAVWGQNWGIPLYRWQNHEKTNYQFWRERVQETAKIFHYFRIDHVLGFFRVYAFPWIPERNGEFVNLSPEQAKKLTGGKLPGFEPRPDTPQDNAALNCEDGTRLLSMILDAAGDTKVVAEDLGMVPSYVRPRLTEMGIPGFVIPIFERVSDFDRSFRGRQTYEPLSLVTLGTHDHEPIASFYEGLSKWWHGPDGDNGWQEVRRLMQFLELDADNPPVHFDDRLHRRLIEVLLDTPSWLAVLMVSDLFGTTQRFNEPGIAGDSNWSQRLDRPLVEYAQDDHYGPLLSWLTAELKSAGRSHGDLVGASHASV
jgi:4-alpha-glucanotransferase